ncbi:hypothetical protein GBAR_LOCUS3313 [Geodia barretti]|uniref:Uncharacterized protein n=1 Tax=Geodia barretti TaxID=519541 RepID=A0AA35W8D5_GEOBA|nr:hypothetical protein GBAR_LOCUS3313 [Geodia barretti]
MDSCRKNHVMPCMATERACFLKGLTTHTNATSFSSH